MKCSSLIIIILMVILVIYRILGIKLKFNLLPTLQPGEKVLFVKRWVSFCTCLSSPNYRWSFSLPPLIDQGFFITDRRVLHIFHICRILTQEFDQRFEGKEVSRPKGLDFIKEVKAGKHWLLGPYLQIVSETPKKLWYRSQQARLRLYMRQAESACQIVTEAMTVLE